MKTHNLPPLLFALMIAAPGASAATFTQFSDRTAFEAAAGNFTIETFNDFTTDQVIPEDLSLDIGDFSVVKSDEDSFDKLIANPDPAFFLNDLSLDSTAHIQGVGLAGQSLFLVFDDAISSFGVDLRGINNTEVRINGETLSLPTTTEPSAFSFFGVTSGTGFTTVEFYAIANEGAGLDNVTYTSVAPVPLPAPALMLVSAVGGMAAIRRRRRANKAQSGGQAH